ncbi:hypothetical protein [Saccharopolyspora shandongensis]|uniref:hypothetical protein n=1 Tax=Saccharopolyspora shandongensis TaxID=418495 RepID=UPI0034024C44
MSASVGTFAVILVLVHLTLAAVWLGSMVYSLVVVQPRVARFFPDEHQREDFLLELASGNRWPVAGVICTLLLTASGLAALMPQRVVAHGAVAVLYAAAGAVFCNVSWRHWPARVFASVNELAGFRQRLRWQAWIMLGLVSTAFLVALAASVGMVA